MDYSDDNYYYLNRLNGFEEMYHTKYRDCDRIELMTMKMTLDHSGLKLKIWAENGIVKARKLMFPSTHIAPSDIMKPRNKEVLKGRRVSFEIMFFEEDMDQAKETLQEAIKFELAREREEINILESLLVAN